MYMYVHVIACPCVCVCGVVLFRAAFHAHDTTRHDMELPCATLHAIAYIYMSTHICI